MFLRSAVLIALVTASCAATPPASPPPTVRWVQPTPMELFGARREVFVDPEFDQAFRDDITRAIDQWNQALNGRLMLVEWLVDQPTDKNTISIYRESADCKFIPPVAEPGYTVVAWADSAPGHIIWAIPERITGGISIKGAMLHELGHVLGAQHTEPGTIMWKHNGGDLCLDLGAVSQVAHNLGLPFTELAWCEVTP